ncbi:MAG: choice-of-anchor D domain-containing protein [Betaproteobacteria bacterium]|nr:choice-of-anchor D domain-containing protein [Betaproteobacteria bacterium]
MNARYFLAATLIAMAALAAPFVHAAGQSSTNYLIAKDSVNSGIANTSSANYTLNSTVGEAVSSTQTNSANYRIDAGFRAQAVVNGPVMTLSPPTLNLGSNPVGVATASMNLTVGNQGTSTLTLSALSLTGTNPADFARTGSCTPTSTLLPAATCTITITFTPGGVGARSATSPSPAMTPSIRHVVRASSGPGFPVIHQSISP